MAKSKLRGHDIYYKDGEGWRFECDDTLTVETHLDKACGHCGKMATENDHDYCIQNLKGVMNACCSHGNPKDAYVQFWDKFVVRGEDAIVIQNILKKYRD